MILYPKIQAIYDLIDLGVSKFLIASNNGAGKSHLLASLAVMEMSKNADIIGICTGANASNLRRTLWAQTKKLARKAGLDVSRFLSDIWQVSDTQRFVALAPSKVEAGQGFHAERVVVFIDEATGMDRETINALLSNATGNNSLCVFTFNPIDPDAVVFDMEQNAGAFENLLNDEGLLDEHAAKKFAATGQWLSIHISAFEHPNVITGIEKIPGAVSRSFIESVLMIESVVCDPFYPEAIKLPWKEGTKEYAWMPTPEALARICGMWSSIKAIGFISGSVVVGSWKAEIRTGLKSAGADIGNGEDPSVWTHFDGNNQIIFEQLKTNELGIVATQIDRYCNEHKIDILAIDDTGVGHGVTDRLQELKPRYIIIPVNFASAPKNFSEMGIRQPANARCEMYLLLEKEMRSQTIKILYDKELQRELTAQKLVEQKESIRIEDKSLIRKRIGRSPNKADATALARYGARLQRYYSREIIY